MPCVYLGTFPLFLVPFLTFSPFLSFLLFFFLSLSSLFGRPLGRVLT
jgi:hypothetical protein